MYFDDCEGMVFRPPSEADSFILRVTIGCSHNACSFCDMYRGVKFRIRPLEEISRSIAKAGRYCPEVRKAFLADGNALVMPTRDLLAVLQELYRELPRLRRVGVYAGPKDILRKTPEELAELKAAGLDIAYLGVESGDGEILTEINKGVTPEEMVVAGRKMMAAGIKLSVTVVLGLGGKEKTRQHAANTGALLSAMEPHYASALTLMLRPGTPLADKVARGEFTPLTPAEVLDEQYRLIEAIDVTKPCIFRSNHASNYLPLAGTLPRDKAQLLAEIREVQKAFAESRLRPESWRQL